MKDVHITLLRHDQAAELKEEKLECEHILNDPFLRRKVKNPGAMTNRMRQIDHQLSTYGAEPLSRKEQDEVTSRIRQLEGKISEGMPTEEEMRKNAVGTLGQHQRWEQRNKSDILLWKNLKRQQDPDNTDPDLCNVEQLRSAGQMDRLRTDAQIPGVMSFTAVPQEKWDTTFAATPSTSQMLSDPAAETPMEMTVEEERKAHFKKLRQERMAANRVVMHAVDPDPTPPSEEPSSAVTE